MNGHSKQILFSALLVIGCLYILNAFVYGLIWGGLLALSLWDLSKKLETRWSSKQTAGLLSVLVVFGIMLPLLYVGKQVYLAAMLGYSEFNQLVSNGFTPPKILAELPYSETLITFWKDHIQKNIKLSELQPYLINSEILQKFSKIGATVSSLIVLLLSAVICMYFILKEKQKFCETADKLLKSVLGAESAQAVITSLSFVKGTINGVVLIGMVEGAVLSVPLVLGGVPGGILIGFLAGILGVIPLVMPLLMLPCAIYLYFTGKVLFAILCVLSLLIVWFLFENIYKPKLISDAVKIHPLLVLVSLIGGLQTLGALGLLIGPAVLACCLGVLKTLMDDSTKSFR